MAKRIRRRRDANSAEGVEKYCNTLFADPANEKYPIDTPGRIKTRQGLALTFTPALRGCSRLC